MRLPALLRRGAAIQSLTHTPPARTRLHPPRAQLEWTIRLKPDNPAVRTWRPELTFLNIGRTMGDTEPTFRAVPEGETSTRCFLAYTIHAVFLQRFELRAFPFDTQTLLVQAVLWRSPLERVMKPASEMREAECQPFKGRVTFNTGGHHVLYADGFIQGDVWRVNPDSAVTVRAGHTDERHRGTQDGQRFSTLTLEICIKRRFEFYVRSPRASAAAAEERAAACLLASLLRCTDAASVVSRHQTSCCLSCSSCA